ncbi:tRNA lysidine(34) synthetase TilS [Algimonas arctica]|uniref:tRNA lysidine(34) synthetase TilS n=1 Tax=Algimonas arctica TaxID=1479486 RepID=UPI0016792C44|nr:tRNA lysidine(34) synthetase TilS [Algimonas arctica]
MTEVEDRITASLPADGTSFALAFSGGGDSLALLQQLRNHAGLKAVLHVDHGLRDGSDAEAQYAAALAKSLGYDLVVLTWEPNGPTSGLQEKARQARYGLMGDYCRAHDIPALLTAHHADDQAETVLMRVKRGSGWRGAAGIWPTRYAPVWPELAGVTLYRPALDLSRDDLRAPLSDLDPINDPSNRDRTFARVRARQELADHPTLAQDMLELSDAMRRGVREGIARIQMELKGYHLTHEGQFSVPKLISAPALALIAPIIGGQSGPTQRLRIAEKLEPLASGDTVPIGAGCIGQWDGEILTLSRDPVAISGRRDRRVMPTAVPIQITPQLTVWDGRFMVSGSAGQLHPERRGQHVGFRVLYGRGVRVRNLVQDRLDAALTGM